MHGRVILSADRAQRNTVRVSLTSRTFVVGYRIAGLRCRRNLDRRVTDFFPVDALPDQLIAISQCLPGHREVSGALAAKKAVQLFVVSRDAEFVFGFDVVVLEVIVTYRPVPSD